jgi:site-specific DNA recombinase
MTAAVVATARRAGVYVRISQDRTGQGLGVGRQEKACRQTAQERGWTVTAVYVDNDVSASSGKPRPQYTRMLADLEAGLIDAVVVWDLDRLTRRPIEIESFIDLADRRAIALASVDRDVDLSTDNGRLFARIKGAVARSEVERKAERTKAANLQAAEQGRPPGGTRPFGFADNKVTHHRVEAKALARATHDVLAGESLHEIARNWNRRELRTTTGKTWNATTVRQVLARPRNAGLRVYRGEIVGKAAWKPVVPEETWRALVTLLGDPARRSGPGNKPRWLLSGIARCGYDGCELTMKLASNNERNGARRLVYRCRSGGHLARQAAETDRFVEAVVVERLSRPDAVSLLAQESQVDLSALHEEARVLRARQEALALEAAAGELTIAQMRVVNRSLTAKLAEVEAQIASAAQTSALAELVGHADVRARWDALSVTRKRAIVDTLMTVTVLPVGRGAGRTFDPASIAIGWHGA